MRSEITLSSRQVLARFAATLLLAFAVSGSYAQSDPLVGIRIEPEATTDYNRQRDYGGWVRMNAPYNRCFNVRDQVLADEGNEDRFRFDQPAPGKWRCVVVEGSWRDPYTGALFTDPKRLDIDHLVPLKEAHLSGAHLWPKAKRREYANFLRDPWHLIAVSLSENRAKGDKDPPQYMPPNTGFNCKYLRHWVEVKRRWELSMDAEEAAFVRRRLADC